MGTLADTLDSFSPKYRWKMDETSGNMVNSGSGTGLDLTEVGTILYNQTGPDASTKAIDLSGANNWGTNTSPILGGASGSVVAFWNLDGAALSFGTILVNDDANESDAVGFGFGGAGFGTNTKHLTIAMFALNVVNRRIIQSTTEILATNDSVWHNAIWTMDGTSLGYKMYLDGVPVVTEVLTAGTPPADDAWFQNDIVPIRTIMGNNRFTTGNANFDGLISNICVYTSVLTADDAIEINNAMNGIFPSTGNPAIGSILQVTNRNARGW